MKRAVSIRTVCLLLSMVCLPACATESRADKPEPCPHWGMSVVAPKYMEAWVEALYVKDDRGAWINVSGGMAGELGQAAGWDNGAWAGNSDKVESAGAPMEVYVRWQSLAEPQTYKWRFPVSESVRKALLKQELVKPWYGPAEMSCRSNITIGVAPGGRAIVWNDGFGFQRTEILRGQAEVEPLGPYQGFSKGKYRPMHEPARKYVEKHGIPYGIWDH